MPGSTRARISAFVFAMLLLSTALFAQSGSGTLSGRVIDETGGALPGEAGGGEGSDHGHGRSSARRNGSERRHGGQPEGAAEPSAERPSVREPRLTRAGNFALGQ